LHSEGIGGEGRTRTFEAMRRLTYSQLPLPLGTPPRPTASDIPARLIVGYPVSYGGLVGDDPVEVWLGPRRIHPVAASAFLVRHCPEAKDRASTTGHRASQGSGISLSATPLPDAHCHACEDIGSLCVAHYTQDFAGGCTYLGSAHCGVTGHSAGDYFEFGVVQFANFANHFHSLPFDDDHSSSAIRGARFCRYFQ
jgi:hypothetical protein